MKPSLLLTDRATRKVASHFTEAGCNLDQGHFNSVPSFHAYFPQVGPSTACTNCSLRKFAFFSALNSSPAKLSTSAHSTPETAISYVTTQFWVGTDQSGRQCPCKRTPPLLSRCTAADRSTFHWDCKAPCSVMVLFVWSTVDVGGPNTSPHINRALHSVTCALSDKACISLGKRGDQSRSSAYRGSLRRCQQLSVGCRRLQ